MNDTLDADFVFLLYIFCFFVFVQQFGTHKIVS